jgi:hypothetical protein
MEREEKIVLLETLQYKHVLPIKKAAGLLFSHLTQARNNVSDGGEEKGVDLDHAFSAIRQHFEEIRKVMAEADKLLGAPSP